MLKAIIFIPIFVGTAALATEVERQVEVNAPPSEVWDTIGAFCSISDWYPGIDSCTEETIEGVVHRRLVTADGGQFLEMHKDIGLETGYGYAIIEGPLPVKNYEATFRVMPEGDKSVVVWSSRFDPDRVSEEEAAQVMRDVYDTGLESIKSKVEN